MDKRKLVVLVPCNAIQMAVTGFFERENVYSDLNCTPFDWNSGRDIKKAPPGQNDYHVWKNAHGFLSPLKTTYEKAVILVDAQFPGSPGAEVIIEDIDHNLVSCGWEREDFSIGVFQPELEMLMWSSNNDLISELVRFQDDQYTFDDWLVAEGWISGIGQVPTQPKEALEALIRKNRTGRNVKHSLVCKNFAKQIDVDGCVHHVFGNLVASVSSWFPLAEKIDA